MIIRAKAPLRISFAGGGTDVPPYCYERGGAVLNATIDRYAYASIIPNTENHITVCSLDYDVVKKYNVNEELHFDGSLDLIKAALKNMKVEHGCEVHIHSDAPPGSGLGSSSTMVVALLGSIAKWQKKALDTYELAEMACNTERKDLGISGGFQDQYASVFGGFNFMEFHKDGTIVVNPLRINQDTINELEYNLLLCYTGGIRLSAKIIEDQVQNYQAKLPEVVVAMDELKELAYQMKKELLKKRLNDFGQLLHQIWLNKKKMSSRISNDRIEDFYEAALKKGALGGKLLGAGGGGYLLIYCPYMKKHAVIEDLEKKGGQFIRWAFEPQGVQSWTVKGGKQGVTPNY